MQVHFFFRATVVLYTIILFFPTIHDFIFKELEQSHVNKTYLYSEPEHPDVTAVNPLLYHLLGTRKLVYEDFFGMCFSCPCSCLLHKRNTKVTRHFSSSFYNSSARCCQNIYIFHLLFVTSACSSFVNVTYRKEERRRYCCHTWFQMDFGFNNTAMVQDNLERSSFKV